MTNNPYETMNISINAILKCLKYVKIGKLYIPNVFVMENCSGKLFL